jgi:phosphoribulokinase
LRKHKYNPDNKNSQLSQTKTKGANFTYFGTETGATTKSLKNTIIKISNTTSNTIKTTYLLTYSWSRALLEKLSIVQPLKTIQTT